tara:strand:+ start:2747 stop:3025 length:279 start_codon:yes stop_codon:yes gene_type:complete
MSLSGKIVLIKRDRFAAPISVLKDIIGFNKCIVLDILCLVDDISIIKLFIDASSRKYSSGVVKKFPKSLISEMCCLRTNTIVNKNKKQRSLE